MVFWDAEVSAAAQVALPALKVIEQPLILRPSKLLLVKVATNEKVLKVNSIPAEGEKVKVSLWKLDDL